MHVSTLNKINSDNLFIRYILLTIALLINALVFNILINPTKIVAGGINGIAIIIGANHFINIDPSLIILVLSLIFLIINYIFLGTKNAIPAAYMALMYPSLVKLTSNFDVFFDIKATEMFITAIFAGIGTGIANGITIKNGFSISGPGTIAKILYDKKKISINKTNFIINTIIVLIGAMIFGMGRALYAITLLFVMSVISERVILGISGEKALYIISDKTDEINNAIIKTLEHDTTVFDTIGEYSKTKQKVLMTVIPTSEYFTLKNIIQEIDKDAFTIVTDSYEVNGGK